MTAHKGHYFHQFVVVVDTRGKHSCSVSLHSLSIYIYHLCPISKIAITPPPNPKTAAADDDDDDSWA